VYRRPDSENWRAGVFVLVVLFHAILAIVLLRASRLLDLRQGDEQALEITFIREPRQNPPDAANAPVATPRSATEANKATVRKTPQDPDQQSRSVIAGDTQATAVPPIDWESAAQAAADAGIANAEQDKLHRNLSGPSPAQLEWIRKNAPSRDSQHHAGDTDYFDGGEIITWVSDRCYYSTAGKAVYGPGLQTVRICKKPGRAARGDLLNNMQQYLDERLTAPLP